MSTRRALIGLMTALALIAGACGDDDSSSTATDDAPSAEEDTSTEEATQPVESSSPVSAERCEANEAAGTITYLTNFQFAATPGILDVVAADDLGIFEDYCLSVDVTAGDANNAQLVAAGTATMARLGSPADLLTAHANGIEATAVATYANAPAIVLLTEEGEISDLTELEGKTLGYKNMMPPEISAMLAEAGVDVSAINLVSVGFDPTILPRGQVDALTGFVSNEPVALANQGVSVDVWNPADFGIESSNGTIIVNPAVADDHPTAVEDFLRATFLAYGECLTDVDTCLGFAEARSESGYDLDAQGSRWEIETDIVADTLPEGQGLGTQTIAQWEVIAELLVDYEIIDTMPDLDAFVDTDTVGSLYEGTELVAEPSA